MGASDLLQSRHHVDGFPGDLHYSESLEIRRQIAVDFSPYAQNNAQSTMETATTAQFLLQRRYRSSKSI